MVKQESTYAAVILSKIVSMSANVGDARHQDRMTGSLGVHAAYTHTRHPLAPAI